MLKELGWQVLVIWECELRKKNAESRLRKLYERIISSNTRQIMNVK